MHLAIMHKAINAYSPSIVVIDPISNLIATANLNEVKSMLSRLIDFLKVEGITAFCTDLISGNSGLEQTEVGISSLIDTWILLKSMEECGERKRSLSILKSRGMAHSNQIKAFCLTDRGFNLQDDQVVPGAELT
jgi:circadian clock protein KaiC